MRELLELSREFKLKKFSAVSDMIGAVRRSSSGSSVVVGLQWLRLAAGR